MLEALLFTVAISFQSSTGGTPPVPSLISAIPTRCVGPGMAPGYRMGEIAVYEKNPKIIYFASCLGGVLKTTDGGDTCKVIFDKIGSASIGDVAVSQTNPDLVWAGTGDKYQRNTVGMGDGIYKSTDGGKTWQDMGLKKSNSISKIAIDPTNDDVVIVAALGSPWGYGPDRGLYKTTDGGKNWRKVLYLNEKSGGCDVAIDPKNPKNMLASLWDHIHHPYGWYFGGPGSNIYRSTDGGETWHKTKGLPEGKLGKIQVGYFYKDPKICAAFVESADPKNESFFRSWDGGETWKAMPGRKPEDPKTGPSTHEWNRAYYCNYDIFFDRNNPDWIHMGGTETRDGGETITGSSNEQHGMWVDPKDFNHTLGAGDGGTYERWDPTPEYPEGRWKSFILPVMYQTYACGYDMRKLYWVMGNGQDTAGHSIPTQSFREDYSFGEETFFIGGDECGGAMADPEDWTTIYSATRCLGMTRADFRTGEIKQLFDRFVGASAIPGKGAVKPDLRASWYTAFQISPWNHQTLYIGANQLYKSVDKGESWEIISPDLSHNNRKLMVSDEENGGGMAWKPKDYFKGDNRINRAYQTIVAICESPMKQGMIWAGTDCGYLQLTMDGGKTWTNTTKNIPGLPDYAWCSKIEASKFAEGRAYVVFNNHRNFDLKSYVYVTEDYGKSWSKITGNLPDEPCRAIKEGMKNPDLLCLGTEFGLHFSLDRGKTWSYYQDWMCSKTQGDYVQERKDYFPRVAVHDLQIQPREDDLIIATHGRGIWTMPLRPLEDMTAENRAKEVYLTAPGNVYLFPQLQTNADGVHRGLEYLSRHLPKVENTQPGTLLSYYLKQDAKDKAKIRFTDASGEEVMFFEPMRNKNNNGKPKGKPFAIEAPAKAGLNSIWWMNNGLIRKPGDYRVVLTIDGKDYIQKLHVEDATDEILAGAKPSTP